LVNRECIEIFKKIEEYCTIWNKFAPAVKLLSGVQEVDASNGYWETGYLQKSVSVDFHIFSEKNPIN
jgi:hypothetical protein